MNRKGMTLIELMAGFAVFTVAMALSVVMVVNAASIFIQNTKMNDDKMAGDAVYNLIQEQLAYATRIQLGGSRPEGYAHTLQIQDGRLLLDGQPCYPEEFYKTKQMVVRTEVADDSHLRLEVLVTDDTGEQRYLTGAVLDVLNLTYYGRAVTGTGAEETSVIYYDQKSPFPENNPSLSALLPPTVEDEGEQVAGNRFLGEYDSAKHALYFKERDGYVLYENRLYRLMEATAAGNILEPGRTPYQWKKIQLRYDQKSSYEKGDVIRLGQWFYRSTADHNHTAPESSGAAWQKVKASQDGTKWEDAS